MLSQFPPFTWGNRLREVKWVNPRSPKQIDDWRTWDSKSGLSSAGAQLSPTHCITSLEGHASHREERGQGWRDQTGDPSASLAELCTAWLRRGNGNMGPDVWASKIREDWTVYRSQFGEVKTPVFGSNVCIPVSNLKLSRRNKLVSHSQLSFLICKVGILTWSAS